MVAHGASWRLDILKRQWLSKSCGRENGDRATGYAGQYPDFRTLRPTGLPATEGGSLRSRFDHPIGDRGYSSPIGSADRAIYDRNFSGL